MLDGPAVAAAFRTCGVSHIIWIPDSDIGRWEPALLAEPSLQLIRVCREGEAIVLAAGLLLGGQKPVVAMQCTGFFEAGDAFRNVVHDLKLPLFLIVGIRSWYAHRQGNSVDTCPVYAEPIVQAWGVPYVLFQKEHTAQDLVRVWRQAQEEGRTQLVLLAE